jgi:hypothetical protein
VLEALFTGEARNAFGQRYDTQGAPLDCGYVTAGLLGSGAKPLERYLRAGAVRRHIYAVQALGRLGDLEPESVEALAGVLAEFDAASHDWNFAIEAAAALVRCQADRHPAVTAVVPSTGRAAECLDMARASVRRGA